MTANNAILADSYDFNPKEMSESGDSEMANIPVQYIIDQIKELRTDMKNGFDKVDARLSGNDGVIERLTTLEVQMKQALDNPPPPSERPKKGLKDAAMPVVGGAGGAGAVIAIVELIRDFLSGK